MAQTKVVVEDVVVYSYDGHGDRVLNKVPMEILVDDDYAIDGVPMPTPSEAYIEVSPMTLDAKRMPGNGQMVAPYLGTAFNVTWKYKWLNAAQFKRIYDTYILGTISKKDMFHTVKTLDTNTGESRELTIYTQDKLGQAPYMIKNGVRYFRDVTLSMVDRAGEV